jgi:uncharacterized protein (TIGR02996 family)
MTDRTAFLAAIKAAPHDDAPRLVYADWLEEHGDGERAEFIRVGCESAGGPNWKDCPDCNGFPKVGPCGLTNYFRDCFSCPSRYKELRERERDLLRANVNRWAADLPILTSPTECECKWQRGFIADLSLTAADWLQHGDAILAEHPVRSVRLTTAPTFAGEWTRTTDGETETFTNARWPGVMFHLPPVLPYTLVGQINVPEELLADAGLRAASFGFRPE